MNYKNIISGVNLRKNTLTLFLLFFVSTSADADGWAVFSQQEQMKNYVIADVGEVSKVEPPFNTKWENDVYQMNGRCFSFSGYLGYWGYGSKAALLLVNEQKTIQLALVEPAIGSTKVELKSITMIECPSRSNITPYSDDPEERLRLLKKRQEELKKKLEEIQRQR